MFDIDDCLHKIGRGIVSARSCARDSRGGGRAAAAVRPTAAAAARPPAAASSPARGTRARTPPDTHTPYTLTSTPRLSTLLWLHSLSTVPTSDGFEKCDHPRSQRVMKKTYP